MSETKLTAEQGKMLKAAQDFKKAQDNVFCAISDYFGEEHPTTLKATNWIIESDKQLADILGELMILELYNK